MKSDEISNIGDTRALLGECRAETERAGETRQPLGMPSPATYQDEAEIIKPKEKTDGYDNTKRGNHQKP